MMNRLMDAVKEDRTAVRGPTHDAGDRVQPGQTCQGLRLPTSGKRRDLLPPWRSTQSTCPKDQGKES